MRMNRTSAITVAALAAFVPMMAAQGAAVAAPTAPKITVTPSTKLADGATVSVSVSGFKGSEDLFVVECAMPKPKQIACDLQDGKMFKTDAKGGGEVKVTVHKTYTSSTPDGKPGPKVDCSKQQGGCVLGAGNIQSKELAGAPISFK